MCSRRRTVNRVDVPPAHPLGPLAQLAEHRTFNPQVVGSNPTGPTNYRPHDTGRELEIRDALLDGGLNAQRLSRWTGSLGYSDYLIWGHPAADFSLLRLNQGLTQDINSQGTHLVTK